ncbi:MAG TPA: hypothetical protein VHJ76_01020 [Actinomycetota bacterium]|nr:hypothetical protein [Actinomycetota bacterium]
MLEKTRRVAAVAAMALMTVPAPARAALGPCRAVPTEIGLATHPGRQLVAIAGAYTAPAGATGAELTCSAVVGGLVYASVPDKVPGPVAVLAGTGWVPYGNVTTCYTLRVTYLTGSSTTTDTCP